MRTLSFLALGALALALSTMGCAADSNDEDDASGEEDLTKAEQTATDADAGKVIDVSEGKNFALRLGSNPTTGYGWKVVSTDRSFAYPYSDKFSGAGADGPVGSGGTQVMKWHTDPVSDAHGTPVISKVGAHKIRLEYRRSFEPASTPAVKSFELTVNIVAPERPATEADAGKVIAVSEGKDFALSLGSNPTTGYGWKVVKTDCSFAYPYSDKFEGAAPSGPVGSGGTQVMKWHTNAVSDAHGTPVISMVGAHKIRLEYRRSFEPASTPAVKSFDITVNVVAAK